MTGCPNPLPLGPPRLNRRASEPRLCITVCLNCSYCAPLEFSPFGCRGVFQSLQGEIWGNHRLCLHDQSSNIIESFEHFWQHTSQETQPPRTLVASQGTPEGITASCREIQPTAITNIKALVIPDPKSSCFSEKCQKMMKDDENMLKVLQEQSFKSIMQPEVMHYSGPSIIAFPKSALSSVPQWTASFRCRTCSLCFFGQGWRSWTPTI